MVCEGQPVLAVTVLAAVTLVCVARLDTTRIIYVGSGLLNADGSTPAAGAPSGHVRPLLQPHTVDAAESTRRAGAAAHGVHLTLSGRAPAQHASDPQFASPAGALSQAPAVSEGAWRLYVYDVPYRALGISAEAEARYRALIDGPTPSAFDEGGLYHRVVRDLPHVMDRWQPPGLPSSSHHPAGLPAARTAQAASAARGASGAGAVWLPQQPSGEPPGNWTPSAHADPPPAPSEPVPRNVLFLLPLSPYHLCKAVEYADRPYGVTWMQNKGVLPISMTYSIKDAHKDGLAHHVISCPTYERALRWLFTQPGWQHAPERHVFGFIMSHLQRASLAVASRPDFPRQLRSVYAEMGKGILVTAEDRLHDWEDALACGHVVLAPYYSPPFFMFDPAESGPVRLAKTELASASSAPGVACHRYDDPSRPTRWHCRDFAMRKAKGMRRAVSGALDALSRELRLNTTHADTARNAQAYAHLDDLLRSKAAVYKRSTFCVIPPGDSAITTRIFSAVAALCIPVFLVPTRFMPFPLLVNWTAVSVSIDPRAVLRFELAGRRGRNPLRLLHELVSEQPGRVAAMQEALAEARWHLLYRDGDGDAADSASSRAGGRGGRTLRYTGPQRPAPSAGRALAKHLVAAASVRQAQASAGAAGAHQKTIIVKS